MYYAVKDINSGWNFFYHIRHGLLRFEGAMNVAETWVNGHYAGKHMGGFLPFVIDVTAVLKENGDRSSRAKLKTTGF